MNSQLNQDLLSFALGELGVLKRLDVRLRLFFSPKARRRLAELDRAAGAVAGAIGAGGAAAFRANGRVKLRRLLLIDVALAALLVLSITSGAFVVWRTINPPVQACANPSPKTGVTPVTPNHTMSHQPVPM
jgi:hypothetical protein